MSLKDLLGENERSQPFGATDAVSRREVYDLYLT